MDEFGFTDLDKADDGEVFFGDEILDTDEDLVEMLNETQHTIDLNGLEQDDFEDAEDDDDNESL
jgi:hypothetical protein